MTWLRYVIHAEVPKFEALGWINTGTMLAHHGEYSALMRAKDECWLPVVGWEGLYEVSNTGHVRSLSRVVNSRGGTRIIPGRVRRPGMTKNGYLQVSLARENGAGKEQRYVAHLVADAWLGKRQDGLYVCHNDGNRTNNHADNLRYDTQVGNMADTIAHGTRVLGSEAYSSKLSEDQVRNIRRLAVTTERAELSKMFGVTKNAIDCIINRRVWAHLPPIDGEVGTPEADARRKEIIRAKRSDRMTRLNSPDAVGWNQ